MFGPFKKERPIQGLTGMGGGAASTLVGGGVAPGISATGGDSIYTYTMPDVTMYKSHVFIIIVLFSRSPRLWQARP